MNKAYFFVPLAALALFIGSYVWSRSGSAERDAARREAVKVEQAAKLAAEQEARRVAIEEALKFQEQRKKERAERDALETARREARQTALDARDQAFREQERLTRQLDRLKREVASEQEAVNRLQIDRDSDLAEQAHLRNLVPQAQAGAKNLASVLDKIAAAEAARLKQAAEDARKRS